MDKNIAVININLSKDVPQLPNISLKGRKPYITWGKNNLYPQGVAELMHYSPVHQAITKLKANLTAGEGFIYPEDYEAPEANPEESFDELLVKLAADKVLFNGYALEIIFGRGSVAERQIAEVRHVDITKIRAEKPNEKGKVENYFISQSWADIKKYPPQIIAAYNPSNPEPRQLLYVFDYTPGLSFYPAPDYSAAINYINLDYEISKFHLNNVRNGLTPSLHINVPEIPEEDERRFLKHSFEQQYRGADNAGKFLLTFSHGAELRPTIDTISTNNNADIFNTLETITTQKIITGHRLASPVLAGLSGGSNSLGSNGGEIVAANQYFMNSVITHYQNPIIKTVQKILAGMGAPVEELSIANTQPIENIFSEGILADILTTNEMRSKIGFEPLEEQPEEVVNGLEQMLQQNRIYK